MRYALCMPKPQIKSRGNVLELERIWSHHYLQQKRSAVLPSIFQNTTAPTLIIAVPLLPAFSQVCPHFVHLWLQSPRRKASFFFVPLIVGHAFKHGFFSSNPFCLFALLGGKEWLKQASRFWDGTVTVALQDRTSY